MLRITDAHKSFGGVRALRGASLEAAAGEVHGLLGPNGSGKSTLNKVLAGSVRPDRASITIDGSPVTIGSPRSAYGHGVAAVYQQLSVVPQRTVEENLLLGLEPTRLGLIDRAARRERAAAMLSRLAPALGPGVALSTPVARLGPGQQQLVEIGKALLRRPRILILDEATASLHRDQVALVLDLVREQRAAGTCVLFVSHRLDEIAQFCDRATILRSGQTVATVDVATTSAQEIVDLMVGGLVGEAAEAMAARVPRSFDGEAVRLDVAGLTAPGLAPAGVSLQARRGEVVGLGGLQGQGQSDLLLTLFGARKVTAGTVTLDGEPVSLASPTTTSRHGIALVPGDRGTQGLFARRSIQENISIASLWRRAVARFGISVRRERAAARDVADRLRIVAAGLDTPVSTLSGGNAQKVVISRWLLNEPTVILLDDPTKGVDVGAKAEIYQIIDTLARGGACVLINSSEDRELVAVCDRVLVMVEGAIRAELVGPEITEANLVSAALLLGAETQREAS